MSETNYNPFNSDTNLFGIFRKHFGNKKFYDNLQYITQYANNNNLPKSSNNYILSNTYGGNFKTKINNHKYEVNVYDVKDIGKKIVMFNYSSKSDPDNYCVSLKIDDSEPTILHIITIESVKQCYKTDDQNDFEKKKGSIMMQIVIKWAKTNNYKEIYLDDTSTYRCDTEQKKIYYDMKHVHTLTSGYPWYYKFGFKFVNLNDANSVKQNYDKLKNVKTSDITFQQIIKCITLNTITNNKYKHFSDKETIINLHNLTQLYDKHLNDNIMIFFNEVTRNACIMMSLMTSEIFETLKLQEYKTTSMYLNL
jgi:hypothetical protein